MLVEHEMELHFEATVGTTVPSTDTSRVMADQQYMTPAGYTYVVC